MKKRGRKKRQTKLSREFIEFGNKKKVFWGITLSAIFLTLIAIPMIKTNEFILICLLLIWILETIYAGFLINLRGKDKKNKIKHKTHNP